MPSKPVPAELATVVRKLQAIARRHNVDYALLAVRGDGRAEIETHHASRGFRSVVRLGLDEDDNVIEWIRDSESASVSRLDREWSEKGGL